MKQTPLEQRLKTMIAPIMEDRGIRLVCLQMHGDTLQIMAEDPKTRRLGVDDCASLSREISAVLDVEDPLKSAYRLEISSPGIDRPLFTRQDFMDYEGFEAKIEIEPALEGRKRFRGALKGMENDLIVIDVDGETHKLPLHSLQKAKLVLTDELIKATKKQTQETEVENNGTVASR